MRRQNTMSRWQLASVLALAFTLGGLTGNLTAPEATTPPECVEALDSAEQIFELTNEVMNATEDSFDGLIRFELLAIDDLSKTINRNLVRIERVDYLGPAEECRSHVP